MKTDILWIVYEHYGGTIHSIHKTEKEASIALAAYKKYVALIKRGNTSVRNYEEHNGEIAEIRLYIYDKTHLQYLHMIEKDEEKRMATM